MNMIYYKTDQFDQFHCIGSECPYTCCNGTWRIEVDEETDARYKTVEGEFGEWLNERIDRTAEPSRMKMKDGLCAMLTPEGLCRIQLELGEDALCNTCKKFPRTHRTQGDVVFSAMSTACPEVALELLKHKSMLILLRGETDEEPEAGNEPLDPLFIELFERCFTILQDPKMDIVQRQKTFLLLNQAFLETRKTGDRQQAETLLRYFAAPENYRAMTQGRGSAPFHLASKLKLVRELCALLVEDEPSPETSGLLIRILDYLRSIEDDAEKVDALIPYFERIDSGHHEQEQANVLASDLMKQFVRGESFDGDTTLQAGYVVVLNQLYRTFCAIGSAREGKLLPVDERAMYWAFLSRGFEHSKKRRSTFQGLLRREGMLELPFLFQLIS